MTALIAYVPCPFCGKTDLLGYFQKHEAEIINYGQREKVGDQVIGSRPRVAE